MQKINLIFPFFILAFFAAYKLGFNQTFVERTVGCKLKEEDLGGHTYWICGLNGVDFAIMNNEYPVTVKIQPPEKKEKQLMNYCKDNMGYWEEKYRD